MGPDIFADKQQRAWEKQRQELRANEQIRAFISKTQSEIALRESKNAAIAKATTKGDTKLSPNGSSADVDPPAIPPSPNKSLRLQPDNKTPIPVVVTDNYDDYLYDLYLRSMIFPNSFYGFCSPFDYYWSRSRYGYGLSPYDDYWFGLGFMSMGWGYPSTWRPFYGMGRYGNGLGYGRGYGYGGYGYGGWGNPGCMGYMSHYMYDDYNRRDHVDRCAVVTVDTFGDAKYQLRINPATLKLDSAEDLEKRLNDQLEKKETIFLVDDEGYELQLTPGTARKFTVEHCQDRY
jgi:hypothetical protein